MSKKTKALKKWAKRHGYKVKQLKMVKVNPQDLMGYLVPPPAGESPFVTPRSMPEWMKSGPIRIDPTEEDRQEYDGGKGLSSDQLIEYCEVHSQRARDEGLEKTGLVIDWCAARIERLEDDAFKLLNGLMKDHYKILLKHPAVQEYLGSNAVSINRRGIKTHADKQGGS